jgi:hypothetical protein
LRCSTFNNSIERRYQRELARLPAAATVSKDAAATTAAATVLASPVHRPSAIVAALTG